MRFMRENLGYKWADYKTNTEVLRELKITSVIYNLPKDRINPGRSIERMIAIW